MRIPKTDGINYGESFLYCPNDNCVFELPPVVACNPFCLLSETRLRIWKVEYPKPKKLKRQK